MSKSFGTDGIAASTQIGKGGTRIASSGGVSQSRTADGSSLARHQGADPVSNDDFATLRALRARRPIWPWWGNVALSTLDPVEIFLAEDNDVSNPVVVQDARTLFLCSADVDGGGFVAKIRKSNSADPDADITFRLYIEGVLAYTETQTFSGDDVLRFLFPDAIFGGQKFAVSFQSSQPLPNDAIVTFTMAINPNTI